MNHRYSNKNEAIQLNRRGESFFDEGLYEEAFAEFSRAIEMDPDMADFHNNLGVCYWHMGEPVKALESLQKTLEIDPSSDDARQNIGNGRPLVLDADEGGKNAYRERYVPSGSSFENRCRAYTRDGCFLGVLWFNPEREWWQPEKVFL